jgi:hypothetical protein
MFSKRYVQSIQLFTPASFEQAKAEMEFALGKHIESLLDAFVRKFRVLNTTAWNENAL